MREAILCTSSFAALALSFLLSRRHKTLIKQPDPASLGFDSQRLERITDYIYQRYVESGKLAGCQILIARHGDLAYFASLGMSDLERGIPISEDTIFRLFSLSKPITSVALMQLYEIGEFQLYDPISEVLPSWRNAEIWLSGKKPPFRKAKVERPITFFNLLTHTAGLSYGALKHPVDGEYLRLGIRDPFQGTLAELVQKLAKAPLRYAPGEKFLYSYSTDVCAYLVELFSGQRFDKFLNRELFHPLGMSDTSFSIATEDVSNFAGLYGQRASKSLHLLDDPQASRYLNPPTHFSGGAGLVGTTMDYWRFCEMLRAGGQVGSRRYLGPRTIELMRRNHLPDNQDLHSFGTGPFIGRESVGIGYGLGFATTLDSVKAHQLGAGDYYWMGAGSNFFWIDPFEDLVVIFMTQYVPLSQYDFRGQLKSLVYSAIVEPNFPTTPNVGRKVIRIRKSA